MEVPGTTGGEVDYMSDLSDHSPMNCLEVMEGMCWWMWKISRLTGNVGMYTPNSGERDGKDKESTV